MPNATVPLFSRLVANRSRAAFVVHIDDRSPSLPQHCANCGDVSSATRREAHGRRTLLIPYCGRCAATAARLDTTQFAAALASIVLVVTLLLTLPRLLVDSSLAGYLVWVVAGALLPLGLLSALRPVAEPDQSCSGRAAYFDSKGQLVCFRKEWAEELAEALGQKPSPHSQREPRVAVWMLSVACLGAALTPSLHSFNYPSLMVLNFGTGPAELFVGERHVGSVEATSLESQRAGTRLRLAAGQHVIEVRDQEGKLVQRSEVRLRGGALHLLKIAGGEYCFWLEEDSYGEGSAGRRYESLGAERDFWVIPTRVDSWFSENPSQADDQRSSGGTMRALRHAPCQEAPAEVGARSP